MRPWGRQPDGPLTREGIEAVGRSSSSSLRRPKTHPAGERPDVPEPGRGCAARATVVLGSRTTKQSRRRRTSTPLGLLAGVLLVIGAVVTVDRLPAVGALHAQTSWRGLVVAPEQRCAHLRRGRLPVSAVGGGPDHRRAGRGLRSVHGALVRASKSETDIEHMVARSEAHDSGLCAADPATRRRFATDLLNLTLAGPRVNRYEKVDHDAAEWLPAQNRCWFAARVIAVRQRYGLTIDRREAAALDEVLAGCASTELITFARGEVPATPSAGSFPGDRRVGRRPERPRQLRGSSRPRDRARDARPSRVPVHARRRRRRRGVRVREAGGRPRRGRRRRRARRGPGAVRTATAPRCGATIPTGSRVAIAPISGAWTATTTAGPANSRRRSLVG